ncbi:dirigent protein 1-like [Musa acuminata AAA Group]|uniref:dirigent protein 1-like n=1 Tax=Musa acuminata AAA Group TaxID=214697 RepID=UPI0031CF8DE0
MASSPSLPLLLLFLFAAVAIVSSDEPKENMTHLHFYLHVYYGGPNATTVTVVSPPGNSTFGSIGVGNNILKEGPEPSSMLIGRTNDLTAQASIESPSYLYMLNFVFTAGEYNGSSIAIVGREVIGMTSERTIVGGTGMFRMARGYTVSTLISSTGTTELFLVSEYYAYIYH